MREPTLSNIPLCFSFCQDSFPETLNFLCISAPQNGYESHPFKLKTNNPTVRSKLEKPQIVEIFKQHATEQLLGKEEIKGELKRHTETNENDNTTYQKFGDQAKAVLSEKFIALQAYLRKTRKILSKRSNITHQRTREGEMKPKLSRRKKNESRNKLNREQKENRKKLMKQIAGSMER